jgi:CBS domain-containing protein
MDMKIVSDVMSADVCTFTEDTHVDTAMSVLLNRRISGAPVLSRNGQPVGVVTIADLSKSRHARASRNGYPLFYQLLDDGSPEGIAVLDGVAASGRVYDVMSPFVLSIEARATLVQAANRMISEEVHRLLVMDETNLVGIVTSMDLLRGFVLEARAERGSGV